MPRISRWKAFPRNSQNLNKISGKNEILLPDTFSDLPSPEALLVATLFHDIGKIGHEHAMKGVTIARKISSNSFIMITVQPKTFSF
nr:HD domain-containing protein [Desulfobacterales bacterium]